MDDIAIFKNFAEFFGNTFRGVDFPLIAQRSIVGATVVTGIFFAYRIWRRPAATPAWYRHHTAAAATSIEGLRQDVAYEEGAAQGLRTQLQALVSSGQSVLTQQPPQQPPPQPPRQISQPPQQQSTAKSPQRGLSFLQHKPPSG